MKKRFEPGDRVKVIFVLPDGQEQALRVEFVGRPAGPGDTFKFYDAISGPTEVNGNGPTFDGIYPDPAWEAEE